MKTQTRHFLTLQLRSRVRGCNGSLSLKTSSIAHWHPHETAIIICDMWDDHLCKGAAKRVAKLAPAINQAVSRARDKGVFIIHAPAGTMAFYEGAQQRRRALDAPFAESPLEFQPNSWNPEREGASIDWMRRGGCGCPEPCTGWIENEQGIRRGTGAKNPKSRQIETIEIASEDAISDNGQEIYNLIQDRKIDHVIMMGVHTNVCVLGRSFGIRQMVYLGKTVVLCRDLTDGIFRPALFGGSHLRGNEMIVEHIEKYWCPTITSTVFTEEPVLGFG